MSKKTQDPNPMATQIKATSKPLWFKGKSSHADLLPLTVGNDHLYDSQLFPFDCIGSAAQAKILQKAGLLTPSESSSILKTLKVYFEAAIKQPIEVPLESEDCHTVLESQLVEALGDVGKKIHTGRSRNDQVLVTTRLFLRESVLHSIEKLFIIADQVSDLYAKQSAIFLPGYTHLQPAMPSSVGMFLHAYYEWILELIEQGISLHQSINKNPLGAAAGFGSSLPLDRAYGAELLGFDRVQRSFVDVQNSRGRYEEYVLTWFSHIGACFEKFAWDIELFFTKEFGFIEIDEALLTGSSIMPQKKNPDLVELLRGRGAMQRSFVGQIQSITAKLPSNYHRDYQLIKEPLFAAIRNIDMVCAMAMLLMPAITFKKAILENRKDVELYATYMAYHLVKEGRPFRDAYRTVADAAKQQAIDPQDYESAYRSVIEEVSTGMTTAMSDIKNMQHAFTKLQAKHQEVIETIFLQ